MSSFVLLIWILNVGYKSMFSEAGKIKHGEAIKRENGLCVDTKNNNN